MIASAIGFQDRSICVHSRLSVVEIAYFLLIGRCRSLPARPGSETNLVLGCQLRASVKPWQQGISTQINADEHRWSFLSTAAVTALQMIASAIGFQNRSICVHSRLSVVEIAYFLLIGRCQSLPARPGRETNLVVGWQLRASVKPWQEGISTQINADKHRWSFLSTAAVTALQMIASAIGFQNRSICVHSRLSVVEIAYFLLIGRCQSLPARPNQAGRFDNRYPSSAFIGSLRNRKPDRGETPRITHIGRLLPSMDQPLNF